MNGSDVFILLMRPKHGLLPSSVAKEVPDKTPNFHKWSEAVSASPSVTGIFNEDENVTRMRKRLEKARA